MIDPKSHDSQKLAYRIDEAVKASGLGRSFLYERIADGSLKSVKVGNCRLILRDDLVKFLSGVTQASFDKEDFASDRITASSTKAKGSPKARLPGQLEFLWKP